MPLAPVVLVVELMGHRLKKPEFEEILQELDWQAFATFEQCTAGEIRMYARILVPLDGSPQSEQVCTMRSTWPKPSRRRSIWSVPSRKHILPYAVSMARTLDMEMILLRAYNPRVPGSTIRMHEVSQIVRDSAENYLKAKLSQLQSEGVTGVPYKIERGVPSRQITDFAIATPNSVTAMCTHGRQG